jgi:hypothetical protein
MKLVDFPSDENASSSQHLDFSLVRFLAVNGATPGLTSKLQNCDL